MYLYTLSPWLEDIGDVPFDGDLSALVGLPMPDMPALWERDGRRWVAAESSTLIQ